ncbi:TPA: NUDIX hydrolase [Candidatus Falkowbacteria bacterium]|nr:NUDIX hydrolase [Candidatus Falkowbacteria bacterium]
MMQVVYARESPPEEITKSIFLAGPSPRDDSHLNWRVEALEILQRIGYDGVVFIPLPRDGNWSHSYDSQVIWESTYLHMADLIVFWIPRDLHALPAFTTNVEFGWWFSSGKATLGFPVHAPKMRYLEHHAKDECVSIFYTLEDTLQGVVQKLGDGSLRVGGQREVPLYIWKTNHFQAWHRAQVGAGNRLDGAKVVWTFRVGPQKNFVFFWAIHVDVYIANEDRHKTNEVVISRPDIATIVAYRPAPDVLDSQVVLIREFRSPATTDDGFIREVPGGSSWKPGENPFVTAAHELAEETGFSVEASRLRFVGARQVAGTLSAHKAHVFACEVTDEELESLRQQKGVAHGVVEDTERTYVEVHRLGDLIDSRSNAVDWSMLGMILTVLNQ